MTEYIIKDLTLDNAFDFCAVLDVIGVNEILNTFDKKEIASMTIAGKNSDVIGADIALKIPGILVKNLPKAKMEICTFLANCLEHEDGSAVSAEEVQKMRLGKFTKLLKEFFAKDDLTDFFGELAGFMGTDTSSSKNVSSGATPIQKDS